MEKGDVQVMFDRRIATKSGYVVGARMIPITEEEKKQPMKLARPGPTEDINVLHQMYGHIGEDTTKWTADHYKKKYNGTLNPCESCIKGKA